MGSGFKDFAAGDILTAADVDGYLMRQTNMTFADASARDSALSGVLDEGMVAYLEDSDLFTFYDGATWRSLGGWTAYTPTWTNVTVGNGTVDFSYSQIGKTVHLLGYFELGSTSSVTGQILFSLPVTASSASVGRATNLVQVTDTGVREYGMMCEVASTGTAALRSLGATLSFINIENSSATNPFTWTNTDIMRMSLTYRAA